MKKLMFAMAAIAAGAAFADDIVSANVVGYTTIVATNAMTSLGPVFQKVGTDKQLYLKDFTAKGMNVEGNDFIQFLDPDTADTILEALWVNEDEYPGMGGWKSPDWSAELDDEPVPAGAAFMMQCEHCSEDAPINYQFSGEVQNGASIVATNQMTFFCNPLPVDLTLGQITAVGMNVEGNDFIQILDPDTADTIVEALWVNEEEVPGMGGWKSPDWMTELDDESVPAGSAFMMQCEHCTEDTPIVFAFPDPLATK